MYKYINSKEKIKIGDVFTDGDNGHTEYRQKNRAKVIYVDKFVLVWFPLNKFTQHTNTNIRNTSRTWCLSCRPKKIEMSDLTEEELTNYNNADNILKQV
jgi:hypothetical protein